MAGKLQSHWPITLTNGTATLFNLALPLALVRILPPDQVGLYNVFFLYVMLSPSLFLVSGLINGLYYWAGKYPEAKLEVRQSWTLFVGVSSILAAIGFLVSPQLALLTRYSGFNLQLYFLSTPFALISLFFEDLMIARGNIWRGSFYSAGFNMFRAAIILAVVYWTRRMEAVFGAFLVYAMIRAVVGWFLLNNSGDIDFVLFKDKMQNVLRYAFPVSLAGLTGLALQNVDKIVLSFLLSPAEFAFYAIGCLSIPPLQILESSVNRVLIPRLSQAFAAKKMSQATELFAESVSELFRFLLPATVGLMIYAGPIVWILFTPHYLASSYFLRFYALSYLFLSIPLDVVARARGDGSWILKTSFLFSPVSILGTWFAAGRWGVSGALVACLTVQFLMRVSALIYQRRCFGSSYIDFLPVKEMMVQTAWVSVAGAISLLLRPFFSEPRTWFLVTGPIFTLIYFCGIYGFRLKRRFAVSEPIHILELVQSLCFGGLERMVYSLARALNHQRPFKLLVVTYDQPNGLRSLVPQFEEAGIPLIQWQKKEGFSAKSTTRLVQVIFSQKTRILHVHDLGPLIYGSLAKVFSLGRVRLILTLHTLLSIQQSTRYRLYFKFFLRFPDRIVAVSPAIKSGLLTLGVNPRRIEVIPNGVTFPSAPVCKSVEKQALKKRVMPHLPEGLYRTRWLLSLARLYPGKGQEIILDIWDALPKEIRAELALFFVGQEARAGYEEFLRQRITRLPDAERVILAGPSEYPQDWLHASDLFISGSLHEGMPLAPLEAVGSGLPTILSNIEGHRFLRPWAHYFDPQRPGEGADNIMGVLEDMRNHGETKFFENKWSATASFRQKWGAPSMTASYAEVFQSI